MARFTCFLSSLLVGKKKKSSKESTKSFHNKQPTGTENPKIKPEELFLEASPKKPVPNADVAPKNPVPNADVAIETICKPDPENDKKLSTNKTPPKPDPLTRNGSNGSTRLTSPKILKRSCSNIERKTITNSPIKKPHSYDDLKNLTGQTGREFVNEVKPDSPLSIKSCLSADKIMLKKRSSSQVLPSRSRKLWWRLFMFSHRNLHIAQHEYINEINNYNSNSCENNGNKGGYSSDTLEIVDEKKNNDDDDDDDDDDNHWVAFNAETSYFDRVNAWVNSIPNDNNDHDDDDYDSDKCDNDTVCREIGESSGKDQIANSHKRRGVDEISQANNIIQSLNIISSVAHIAGMGLKVVPAISSFTSLKAVNLSNNFIVNISGGALPKSLHTLDLSRNKIGVIEGLKELTRLRVLDLSYNKISRIGHGLSNCTAIKELYLAGNKISNVEGLHRLLKLAVLDLSFNKITTTKSLGQLVANYNSLLALNILGNPIQTNIGDDQVKKSVLGLLPKLSFLNKQLIKEKRGREVAVSDRVAKAALGNGFGGSSRRKLTRRVGQNGSGSVRGVGARSDNKGKSRYRK